MGGLIGQVGQSGWIGALATMPVPEQVAASLVSAYYAISEARTIRRQVRGAGGSC